MSGSFSQQLEDLLNPQPKFIDPEDDGDEETKARVIEKFDEDEDEEEDDGDGRPSALRKHAASLLSDTDRRYAGKAVSRKQLKRDMEDDDDDDDVDVEDDEEEGEGDDDDEQEEVEEEEESEEALQESDEDVNDDDHNLNNSEVAFCKGVDFHKLTKGMDDLGVSEGEEEEEDEEESGEESEEESDEEESREEDDMEQDYDNSTVRTFSQVNEEVEKGKAVKNQLALWDLLLEGRIKFQKALLSANQLPQPLTFPEFKKNAEFAGALKNSHKALKALQRSLLELHDELLVQNADTRAISLGEQNEEILSDEEDCEIELNSKKLQKRKLEMAEYPDLMAKRFAVFTPYQNTTLQKWHDKTRLTMGKTSKSFGAFERNILTQIEQVLMDKERLIKRTQTRRSEYKVMGKKGALTSESEIIREEPEKQLKTNSHLKDVDEDIFDDDDFYHQLLRELIERKTSAADPNDQVAMGRQWLAIQKLRSKIKKKVDTKASKGRKVRYHVHSKLVNFMAPMDHSAMTDEAKSELYRGLFGQNATTRE
ncbi:hypothetical protein NL108_009537 [Boleophthalmus pectinirostris]|uniref:protein AATF n=1 Tax=Boleophthalmus pectinirostris TaxID=150288 RepID=UPI00242B4BF4|nr:protein AATF [Boleophthalmus pectinirostris]KAJ0065395.1 hypothetical protein NL108_009537 [Boleophthalmus pectinirostris]